MGNDVTDPAIIHEPLSCGHQPWPTDGLGTGYGQDRETGKTYCYPCTENREWDALKTADRYTLYRGDGQLWPYGHPRLITLGHLKLVTWTGLPLANIMTITSDERTHKTYYRAIDVHGKWWYGVGPNESGTYVNLRRFKNGAPRNAL